MRPFEIFETISPDFAGHILDDIKQLEKGVYRAAIDAMAKPRKLRPVFIERKPRAERNQWMKAALSQPAADGIAENLLQIWLVRAQNPMLCEFLDGLAIEHDGQGMVESLPEAPPREKIEPVVAKLLAGHPRECVALYLHAFQAMDISGWPTLAEILGSDARLTLQDAGAPQA